MRILILSLVLALPFATVASAQDGADERSVGLGADVSINSIGQTDSGVPRVDNVFLRWQVTPGFALEPRLGLIGSRSSIDNDAFSTDSTVAVGLGGRFRAAKTNHVAALILADTSFGRTRTSSDPDGDDEWSSASSAAFRINTGLGLEYAPKRHWALGLDYEIQLLAMDTNGVADQFTGTSWRVGPTSRGQLNAHATVYF